MDCDISRHSLHRARGIKQKLYLIRGFVKLSQLGKLHGIRERYAKLTRYRLCHHVNVRIRHSKRSAHISYRRARRKRAKRNYLRHVILAVFFIHISDNFLTAIITEVNVNIGHTYTLGIQKSLKKQIKFKRIHIGYSNHIRNKASRARSTSRAYGDLLRARKVDVILNYQKIVGKAHIFYHGKLVFESCIIFLARVFREDYLARGDLPLKSTVNK